MIRVSPGGRALAPRSAAHRPVRFVACLGRWVAAPSPLAAMQAELLGARANRVVAHSVVARTLLPPLTGRSGSHASSKGPSALAPWPVCGLVAIATATQAMLVRALAGEAGRASACGSPTW